eukprot:3325317-Amphidinium_carterae.1
MELATQSNASDRPEGRVSNPGTIAPQAARVLAIAAKKGRIGPAWEQLWSYGVAPSTVETAEAVQRKWAPEPSVPLPATLPLPPTEITEAVVSQKQLVTASHAQA